MASIIGGKQKRYLRGLGHALEPVVQVGKDGITDAVVDAVERALVDHELIKVKIGQAPDLDRHATADELARRTSSAVAQVLGRTILLYRASPDGPRISLP